MLRSWMARCAAAAACLQLNLLLSRLLHHTLHQLHALQQQMMAAYAYRVQAFGPSGTDMSVHKHVKPHCGAVTLAPHEPQLGSASTTPVAPTALVSLRAVYSLSEASKLPSSSLASMMVTCQSADEARNTQPCSITNLALQSTAPTAQAAAQPAAPLR